MSRGADTTRAHPRVSDLVDDATLRLIDLALAEDVGSGDWTTRWTVPARTRARAHIIAKSAGIAAGFNVAFAVFHRLDPRVQCEGMVEEGEEIQAGDVVSEIRGPARPLLTGERTALNFLQRLSGVATLTRRFVDAVEGTGVTILDTRKTTPGWRAIEKAAVRVGGGTNHRAGLYDAVLIKENHIAAAGGLREAAALVAEQNRRALTTTIEVRSLEELDDALKTGVQRILLDNFDLETLGGAVQRARALGRRRPRLEASGNVDLEHVRAIAETGVDEISIGALTHSAPIVDFSLRVL